MSVGQPISMIAERLALDPLDFRRKNLLRDHDSFATGEELTDIHFQDLLDHAAISIDWSREAVRWLNRNRTEPKHKTVRRGKGVAMVIKATITPSTSAAALKLNEDGSLNVLTSSVECGQGAKTVLAQIAADAMHMVLRVLDTGGAMSQADLARAIGVPASKVVGLVDELQADGLVERLAGQADRRVRVLHG